MCIKKQPVKLERENKVLTFIPGLKSEVFPFALIIVCIIPGAWRWLPPGRQPFRMPEGTASLRLPATESDETHRIVLAVRMPCVRHH